MEKILITGGCGFIGSNLAAHYLGMGWEVVVYDNFSRPGALSNAQWLAAQGAGRLAIVEGDIRDGELLFESMAGASLVAHLAAQVAVTTSVEDPREDFLINALGGFNVLDAARRSASNPIVVYASTNKVYGALGDLRVDLAGLRYQLPDCPHGISEEFPIDLHSPYGCSKGAIDLYMLDYARIYGLRTVVLRQSCIYGPRQFGIEDQGWVAHFVISAMQAKPITIYGDGKQVRDVLHVSDLLAAFDQAVSRIDICRGQAYNLGGGPANSISLLELVQKLDLGRRPPIALEFSGWRPGDQKVYISDVRKAQRDLGWAPTVGIDAGLADLRDWVEQNRDLFRGPPRPGEAVQSGVLPAPAQARPAEPVSAQDTAPAGKRLARGEPSNSENLPVLLPKLRAAESTARRMKAVTKETPR